MSALSAGETLLRLLGDGAGTDSSIITAGDGSAIDWSAVLQEAVTHEVEPLLDVRLRAAGAAVAAPHQVLQELHVRSCCQALSNRQLFAELAPVLSALTAAGIPVIVLKGAMLAEVVYRNESVRPMGDVDLLVRAADVRETGRVLVNLGYRAGAPSENAPDYATHHHVNPYHKRGAVPIEIHRSIVPLIGPVQVDLEGMWGRARPARIAGIDVLALSAEDLLLHLCVHVAYNHGFQVPLRALYDIAATVGHYRQEIDWRRFRTIVSETGSGRGVSCALQAVHHLFGTAVSPLALGGAEEPSVLLIEAVRDIVLGGPGGLPVGYAELRRHDDFRTRVLSLASNLFPPRQRLRRIYRLAPTAWWVGAYYLYRPVDLLLRRGWIGLEILVGTRRARAMLRDADRRRLIERWLDGGEADHAGEVRGLVRLS